MGRSAPAAAVSPTTTVAAARWSATSSRRAAAWVRLRTLSWFAAEAGSKVSRIRAASRNKVRAPRSAACTRASSGVQRAVSSAQTGENVAARGPTGRQRQTRNRGSSTSTVPNRVCSRRVRALNHDCCRGLPIGRLEPEGDGMGAGAHALMIGR